MAERMVEVLARLPREDLDQLRARAAEADRPVAAELRRAVRQYLGDTPASGTVHNITISGDADPEKMVEAIKKGKAR
jgi:hypothetical protein